MESKRKSTFLLGNFIKELQPIYLAGWHFFEKKNKLIFVVEYLSYKQKIILFDSQCAIDLVIMRVAPSSSLFLIL
jgi:hypothetical protein